MLKGFKDFVLRGNVIDLAVAVVIGAAFTAIVNGVVTGILNPVISLLFDSSSIAKAGIVLRAAHDGNPAVVLAWGAVISAIIQFLLIAVVVYFGLIVPMNRIRKLQERRRTPVPEEPEPLPADIELLTEIRDLLKQRSDPAPPRDQ